MSAGPEPDEPTPETLPSVVAVVVTHDPGPWFDECLASLRDQTYDGLSVLVLDTGSAEDPTSRIAAVLPGAYVRRLGANPGFGPAINEAMSMVEGAAFYLLCHDDVALEPDAVRTMVLEAFRSNGGLVGPKLVSWDDPEVLLQVGAAVDKTGVLAPYAERGELDQEQHDAVRDAFVVTGGCQLIRADLLDHLGGFDPAVALVGDDRDLSWRAHVAGARVLIVPAARVRHREALAERSPVEGVRALEARHRVRAMLTCYGFWNRLRVVPQALVLTVIEVAASLLTGRTQHAREQVAGWTWNLRHLGSIRTHRKAVRAVRSVPDSEVRRLQVRGSARFRAWLRSGADGNERLGGVTRSGRRIAGSLRAGPRRNAALVTIGLLVLLAISSRDLITGTIPSVGEFASFPSSPTPLLQAWVSGWRTSGLGSTSPAPTAYGILGLLGTLFLGAMGALRQVLILAPIPIGALGAWRLARPIGSRRAAVVAFVVYVAIPLPYNALANGSWGGLLMYATAPWLLRSLARTGNLAPYATRPGSFDVLGPAGTGAALVTEAPKLTEQPSSPRYLIGRIMGLGLLLAVVGSFVPFVVVMSMLVGIGLAVGSVVAGRTEGVGRILGAAFGAPVVAFVLQLPWSSELFATGQGWATITGARSSENSLLSLGRLIRFQSGPFGAPPLGWALLVAAALPLVIGRGWRFEWASRAWFVALVSWGALFAGHEGWLPFRLPPAEVVLAPAAIGLSLAAALGMAAFEIDLPGYRFGWRQVVSIVAALGVVIGSLSVFAGVVGGRWKVPGGDFAAPFSFVTKERQAAPFRILWLGDPEVLPLAGWRIDDRLSYATTDNGLPTVADRWTAPPSYPTPLLSRSVGLATARRTVRLGRLLAPMGVRYVIVPLQPAPVPYSTQRFEVPASLRSALAQQLDLEQVDVNDGVLVYRNRAWAPTRAQVGVGTRTGPTYLAAAEVDLSLSANVLPKDQGTAGATGKVDTPGTVLVGSAADAGWKLEVGGASQKRSTAWGWGNKFTVTRSGAATLSYDTPTFRYVLLGIQVLLWLVAFAMWRRFRRGPDPEGPDPARTRTDPVAVLADPAEQPVISLTPLGGRVEDADPLEEEEP